MITTEILLNNGFLFQELNIERYGHIIHEYRYYYGPYLYIAKDHISKSYYIIEDDDRGQKYIYLIDLKYDEINDIINICKLQYKKLNEIISSQIKDLQNMKTKIINYI